MSTREPVFHPRPAVIGHRGCGDGIRYGARENTLASFATAVRRGLRWVEVDARRTGDDRLVVHHNPTTDDGDFVVERAAADLATGGMALLEEALEALPPEVGVNIDVKTELEDAVTRPDAGTGALLVPVLRRERGRRRLLVSSFDPAVLLYLRDEVPDVPLGLLTWVDFPVRHAVPAAAHLGFEVVGVHTGSFGPNRVESGPVHRPIDYTVAVAHRAGLEVAAWCPNPEAAAAFLRAGGDAVVVNEIPPWAVPASGDAGSSR